MNNKALLDKLAAQLSILEHHIKRLKKNPDELHELDIELMGEKIKGIYSLIHELEAGNAPKKQEPPVVKEVEKVSMVEVKPEPEIPAPKAPEMSSESPVPRPPSPEPEVSSELEVDSSESEEKVVEPPPVPHSSSPDPIPHTTDPIPKTTADLFSGPTTIADSFQAGDDNSLAAKVNPTAVQDLKMAIGINDKFLFINELFKGDPSVYNQAIDSLNTAGGITEAEAAIESFRGEYAWVDNSEAYHRLKKIVKSKYSG